METLSVPDLAVGTQFQLGAAPAGGVAVTVAPPLTAVTTISTEDGLIAAIDAVDALTTGGHFIFDLANDITETEALNAINLHSGVTLTIDGQGHTLDGADTYRGFFAYAGAVTFQNLAINNTVARGGDGGFASAGGGAGLGGGLFITGSNAGLASGAAVTLSNVIFNGDGAGGGSGSGDLFKPFGSGGGGGGLGGNGGNIGYPASGGGGGGIGANGSSGAGIAGIVPGAAGGGSGVFISGPNAQEPGGANGGSGGGAGNFSGPGGGGGIGGSTATAARGGDGGFGGGGGADGGNGGFGGGGGSGGGNGGFGGGGAVSGKGGFGGGDGADPEMFVYEGGGGLGAGGAIFVQAGGSLTIQGGGSSGDTVTGGAGGVAAAGNIQTPQTIGSAFGSGIFLQGNQTLAFSEAAGVSTTIADVIADQTGSGGIGSNAGNGGVALTGPGTLTLAAANSYSGATTISGGTLILKRLTAVGIGTIAFVSPTPASLVLEAPDEQPDGGLSNPVVGFGVGDTIEIASFTYMPGVAAVLTGQRLQISSGGKSGSIVLPDVLAGTQFQVTAGQYGGIAVALASPTAPVTVGAGPNSIALHVSEDAYQGNAQFTVAVDGVQVGGVQMATALRSLDQDQVFNIQGSFSPGPHTLTVNFLNDLYGGTPSTDRNLYVTGATVGSVPVPASALALTSGGQQSFGFAEPGIPAPYQPTVVLGSGPDLLALQVAEDAYQGDAQFTVSIDGNQIGGTQIATALHGAGSTQAVDVLGNFGPGVHSVAVNFLNDAYGGGSMMDRNLFVNQASIDNAAIPSSSLSEFNAGPQSLSFQEPADTLTLDVSEDAYQGDATYQVLVDGYIQDYVQTVTASHGLGQIHQETITGAFGHGPHTIGVTYLDPASNGTPGTTRSLYVDAISFDGEQVISSPTQQSAGGTFYTAVPTVPTPSVLTLHLAEDAYQGDAQFGIAIDGQQLGGSSSVTASHSTGATQSFSFADVLSAGTHDVAVSFLNDAYGGSPAADRNLFVAGADLNGTALSLSAWSASLLSNGTDHFSLVVPP